MNIHEYQAKELLRKFNILTPNGQVATSPDDAAEITKNFGGKAVVKAQIHAGGRGKGGGVKFAQSPEESSKHFSSILGMTLITPQTGPMGKVVKKVYLSDPVDIAKEFYFSFLIDRISSRVSVLASEEGGVEIEKVAEHSPEKIIKFTIDPALGLCDFQIRALIKLFHIPVSEIKAAHLFFKNLYQCFITLDCSLIEVNPLVLTSKGQLVALDAKMSFDDNAVSKHPDVASFRDLDEEVPEEIEAGRYNLNFIKLDGSIGCMVNGAGLAMATMDIIHYYGSSPANFLDVGGGATEEAVKNAFRIILQDPSVKAVLVNIFGGIMRCDVVATGIVKAAQEMKFTVPVVVRLEGTNVAQGQAILKESKLNFIVANDLKDAALKVVEASKR